MASDTCGAKRGALVCDRPPHVDGDHRGYDEEHDSVLFWPTEARLLEELVRAIRIALAAVGQEQRREAAEHLKRAIDDAYGGSA